MNITSYQEITSLYKKQFEIKGYPFHFKHFPADKYIKSDWIRIPINLKHYQEKFLPFIIASNELFRFQLVNDYPVNILSDGYILARRIQQEEDVGEFRIRTLFYYRQAMQSDTPPIWRGMGRGIFLKYFYQDNDFNITNAIIDKEGNFIVIDHDQSLWPVVEKYHHYNELKVLTVNNYPGPVKTVRSRSGELLYVIPDKKRGFMGKMHVRDYEQLPKLTHQHPSSWFLIEPDFQNYARILSSNAEFSREKHLAALKIHVTAQVQKLLVSLHLNSPLDIHAAHTFLDNQQARLITVFQQSPSYQQFIMNEGDSAIALIEQEIHQFFSNSHYYKLDDEVTERSVQSFIVNDCMQRVKKHLEEMKRYANTDHGVMMV